ncbi:hypothetical protein I0C86_35105 [Plantactinospora sp. S1510]|uniref:DUF4878 domain-containing protein n=2 Tax=Plantactinospora alkalitolerans TaxID=2789879 RepID=A0ABS0H746_9ACTN|nr:hypothetical protein [Plantactinospora alkalitolerans]
MHQGFGPVPPDAPAPPPGPGAVPPFAAPPSEGRGMRMWLGIGVAALAVVLFCGGGGAALVGLLVSGAEALNEQARTVVGEYLDAVDDEEFSKAYHLLCDAAQQQESPAEFQRRVSAEPEIASFQVGDVSLTSELSVPVDVTYASGGQDNLRALLDQDSAGGLKVCDIS